MMSKEKGEGKMEQHGAKEPRLVLFTNVYSAKKPTRTQAQHSVLITALMKLDSNLWHGLNATQERVKLLHATSN